MRLVLAILLFSVVTVLASEENYYENSGENPNIPHVTDDEDMDDGSAASGDDDVLPVSNPTTTTTTIPAEDFNAEVAYTTPEKVDTIPEEELGEDEVPSPDSTGNFDVKFKPKDMDKNKVHTKYGGPEVKNTDQELDIDSDAGVMKSKSVFDSSHFLTAAIIGGCIGFLFALALIMLLLYRMRKKDEGSYALDDQKKHGAPPAYAYTQGQEYYA